MQVSGIENTKHQYHVMSIWLNMQSEQAVTAHATRMSEVSACQRLARAEGVVALHPHNESTMG